MSLQSAMAAVCLFILSAAPGLCRPVPPAPPRSPASTNAFLNAINANFSTWDTNHDGRLSTAELDAAIENPATKGPAAAALATLREAVLAGDPPPLRLANIRKLARQTDARRFYSMCLKRIPKATHHDHELFVSGLPQLDTIQQGLMGDCFSLAPLGAMVYRDPHEVASWFKVQSHGNVLVKMAAGTVTVHMPTDAELAFASANSSDGIWIDLYEKAIAEARNERKPPGKRLEVALDTISKGGDEEPILSYITAHRVTVFPLSSERGNVSHQARIARLRAKVAFASSNKLVMVADTDALNPPTPGLTEDHAYALLGYDSGSDAVKLWNPHGNDFNPQGSPGLTNGYPMTNGIFVMPLPDFASQFDRVVFERPETTSLKWTDQWELMAEAGRFTEAATDLAEVIDSDESENWLFYALTPLLIQSGRLTEYTNHCKLMLDQFEHTSDPSVAERTSKSCLLLPSVLSPNDFARATNLASRAVSLSPAGSWLYWRLMTRGLSEYRAGRYDVAIATEHQSQSSLSKSALVHKEDLNGPACKADTYFISAMAHERLNQTHDAQANLEHGLDIVRKQLPKLDCGDLGYRWFDTLMSHIIMQEAQQTIKSTPAIAEKP
ncbi:MAG TPA: C2 family cysteine protease [Alphaproteobacteria bacterium]|nr:C2 family cysteine protease [Alphaproteobacteria bacterium]